MHIKCFFDQGHILMLQCETNLEIITLCKKIVVTFQLNMRKSSRYQRTLEDILDSDDELTTDYIESSYIPAYQDDTRFEYFGKLLNKRKVALKNKDDIQTTPHRDKIIKNGIFSKKDLLCLQCVQRIPSDTLLWFFEFLIYKDLQSNYKFLKSCLVPKYDYYYSKLSCKIEDMCKPNETQYRYKIVLNK